MAAVDCDWAFEDADDECPFGVCELFPADGAPFAVLAAAAAAAAAAAWLAVVTVRFEAGWRSVGALKSVC